LNDVYILSAVRTPIGKFGGSLVSQSAADMGVVAAKAAIHRAGVQPQQVEETIFGNARQAGGGPNPARQISIRSGVPQEVPAYTVNKACASGLKSIALAYQEVATGNLDCVLAGGTESMSRLPYYLDGARWGYRLGDQELVDGMYRDGFFCPLAKMVMGETAEVLAGQYKINREEQDEFALISQARAAAALASDRFKEEVVPVTLESKKGPQVFARDEHPFPDASLEKLAKLSPVFSKTGTITAGNSSGITDGAAAVVIASESFAKKNNLRPLARILAVTSAGVDPRIMGIGPVPALRKMEQKHGLRPRDAQRQRRRDRSRPPHRLYGHAHHGHVAARTAQAQGQAWRCHPLYQRWNGYGARDRKCGMSDGPDFPHCQRSRCGSTPPVDARLLRLRRPCLRRTTRAYRSRQLSA
jgi:acetyl-CoA C-acetyltransferase